LALFIFFKDIKSGHQVSVILTFPQAKEYGVCQSPSTFNVIKKELVEKGFLDPFEPGGLGKHSTFKISFRWKFFGTNDFNEVPFKPGNGSKYFKTIWKDGRKKKNLLEARHGRKNKI